MVVEMMYELTLTSYKMSAILVRVKWDKIALSI